MRESTQGYPVPVDDSGLMLEQGGYGPSPLGALSLDPDRSRGVGVTPPCSLDQSRQGTASPVILTPTANLKAFLPPPKTKVKKCELKYAVLGCGCERKIVPSVCMSLDCKVCQPWVTIRRANSVSERIRIYIESSGHYCGKYVKSAIYSVFTVPVEVRERYYIKSNWQRVRVKVWKLLKEKFGALFGVEATHPIGDPVVERGLITADSDGQVFHPHLNFLWVQRDGWSPFLDVKMLREAWSSILGVPNADVWTNYSSNRNVIWKWCKYIFRSFPGMHQWCGSLRWYGHYPKGRRQRECLCPKCGEPYRLIGWISAYLVEEWRQKDWITGVDPPWENDSNIHLHKVRRKKEKTTPDA